MTVVSIKCRVCKCMLSEKKFFRLNYIRFDGVCKKCKKNYENDKKGSD